MITLKYGPYTARVKEADDGFTGAINNIPNFTASIAGSDLSEVETEFADLCKGYEEECRARGETPRALSWAEERAQVKEIVETYLSAGCVEFAVQQLEEYTECTNPLLKQYACDKLEEIQAT